MNLNLKTIFFSMDIHKNHLEYYLHYPKYSCQFLAKTIKTLVFFQFEVFTYNHHIIAVIGKQVNICKKSI